MARRLTTVRRATICVAALLLAACGAASRPTPATTEQVLPEGLELARGGFAAGGEQVVALAAGSGGACRTPALLHRRSGEWRWIASGSPAAEPPCPPVSTRTDPDGRVLASHDGAGAVQLWRITIDGFERDGEFRLGAGPSFPFPPPGPNLAFSADGRLLLVGTLNRACHRVENELRCGVAELAVRGPAGWRGVETIRPPADATAEVRFGQAVAITADGRLAVVGGTGQPGRSGALWLFVLGDGPARAESVLRPERDDPWFGNDLSLAADGSWLAVGGSRAVYLFQAAGAGYALRRRLTPPEASAGYFGEALALSADGRTLLVGAPRASCAKGERCGRAYLYRRQEAWTYAGAIEPAMPVAEANFARRLAIDRSGRHAAVQGAALRVLELP